MMTFGIIGGGMIAHHHAQAIQASAHTDLGAIYARDPEKANRLGIQYNCKGYSNLNQFLKDDSIQIVTIATPSGAHMEPAIAAANAGKHIICEKPLEITTERIGQMIAAADSNNVILSGIFNRRFNPAVRALKRAIDTARFGTIALCDAQIKWFRDQAYYDSGQWRGTWALDGGGALMNQSIHTIDLLLYLAGPVKRLSATMATLSHDHIEVEDTAVAILEFENGARGTIQGSTSCWSSSGHPAQIQICGNEGSVFMTDESFTVWDFKNALPEDDEIRATLMNDTEAGLGANDPGAINYIGHQRNFEDVVLAIENNKAPMISGPVALKAVEVICAIYESAKNDGAWINLNSQA